MTEPETKQKKLKVGELFKNDSETKAKKKKPLKYYPGNNNV